MKSTTEPVSLAAGQMRETARVLARAFHDDPGVVWLFSNEGQRRRFLYWFFTRDLRYGRLFGHMHTTPGDVAGAAIWLPPEQPHFTLSRLAGIGYLSLPLRMGPGRLVRFLASMDLLGKLHKRDAPPRHWYLATIGVDPPHQGQGIGGALMRPGLERADREGLACYLETGKEINVRFYRKHGFETVVEGYAPLGGPEFWTMLREPRAA